VIGVATAMILIALGILGFLMFGLEDCIQAWHNGRTQTRTVELQIEQEKTKRAQLGNDNQRQS
jgi:hypothetical protein